MPALILLAVLGFALRVFALDDLPFGVHSDEGANAASALRALQNGDWRWF